MSSQRTTSKIRQFFHESFGTYGAVRIHKDLLDAGYEISERTLGNYMQQMGLIAIPNNPYTVTTDSNHSAPNYDDLLEQNFEVDKPNQVWVNDITNIWTIEGWLAANHMRKDLA